jgi:hypothetical protein
MTLSQCIEEYVPHRRSLGVCFHGEQVRLRAFLKSAGDGALPAISAESVRRYIDGKGPVTQAWFSRFHTVAGFYRFAIARQYTAHSPLPPRPPKPPAEFIPYIYSEPEVRALLDAVDARHEEDWLVRPQTVRTLLLLLYATGLRISEALALTTADVDLHEAILTIRETKFYKSRLVPIGADLVDVLVRYRDQHPARPARRPDDPFLSDRHGRPILRQTRFMHCHGAKPLSHMYSLLSENFVHGTTFVQKCPELSCDFVDRGAPDALAMQYQLAQATMALIYYEIFLSIPEDDRLCDELAALSIASGLLLPVLSFASDATDPELKRASDQLLAALSTVSIDNERVH